MYSTHLLVVCCFLSLSHGTPFQDATEQVVSILKDPKRYNKEVIPMPQRGPLTVRTNMLIRSLDIDDINMQFTVDMTFRMMWRDPRLFYNVNVSSIKVSNILVMDWPLLWVPDPFFKGSVSSELQETIRTETMLRVDTIGRITFSSRLRIKLACPMNLSRFPHDSQICKIPWASYGFIADHMNFTYEGMDPIQLGKNVLVSNRFQLNKYDHDYCTSRTKTGTYSCLIVSLYVRRVFSTYLLEWYLPCIFLVLVSFFSELVASSALLPRLLLTVAPLLTISACSLSYSQGLSAVPYTRAYDLFTGISLLVVFATLLHVIIGYYYQQKPQTEKEEKKDDERCEDAEKGKTHQESKFANLKKRVLDKADFLTRLLIIGFYVVFLFLYFVAYLPA